MKKYYIYHIKGKKIGCTIQPKRRTKTQGFDNYEILEEHTDIYIASDRERELQKEWGYPVDLKPYWKTIKMPTKESRIKGGKKTSESGQLIVLHKSNERPIIQMDMLGNYITEYSSIKQAENILDLHSTGIILSCKQKRKSTGGFTFKYK
jgi:hypothetical protein